MVCVLKDFTLPFPPGEFDLLDAFGPGKIHSYSFSHGPICTTVRKVRQHACAVSEDLVHRTLERSECGIANTDQCLSLSKYSFCRFTDPETQETKFWRFRLVGLLFQ